MSDTAFEVRKLRNQGVCVLGVFAGEEKGSDRRKENFWEGFRLYPQNFRFFTSGREIFNETIREGSMNKVLHF